MMEFQKMVAKVIVVGTLYGSTQLFAHTYTFTNATEDDISIDIHGIAVIGGSMMQGKIPSWHGGGYRTSYDPETQTTRVQNAGYLTAPYRLKAGHTVALNFNGIDFGICLNKSKVFINGVACSIKELPEDQYDELSTHVKNLQDRVTEYAPHASKLPGKAGTYAGYAAMGAPVALSGLAKLVRMSTCKNMSFMIVKDETGTFQVITRVK